jgi:O-antigen ligase/Flp pilus assembly protein TadD
MDNRVFKLNLLDWLVIAFTLLQIISSIFGVNFIRSFWGYQQRAQGVFIWLHFTAFYFLIRYFFTLKKDWENLLIWVLSISFISSFLAWFGGYLSMFQGIINKGGKLSGMISNSIFFSAYLIIPVFLGFALFFILERNNKWRWFGLAAGIFNLVTFLFSQQRGALLGLLGGIFLILIFYLICGNSAKLKKTIWILGAILIVSLVSAYIFNQKNNYLKNNFPSIFHLLNINPFDVTASTRLMAWKIAFQGWRDRPIFGWGPENYEDIFDKHYNPAFLKYTFSETVWDKPHSFSLEVLSTMGIFGFAGYLIILAVLFFYIVRILKRGEDEKVKLFYIILGGAAAAYIIQNSFGIESSNSLQLWFLLIAFASFLRGADDYQIKILDSVYVKKLFSFSLVAILILSPYLIYKNYTFFKASVLMGDAEDAAKIESLYLFQKNAPKVLDEKVPFLWEQAVFLTKDLSIFDAKGKLDKKTLETVAYKLADIYEENVKKYPTSYLMRFWGGQLYDFMGEYIDKKYYDRGDELLKQAWEINKTRQNSAIILAKSYLLQNRNKEGIKLLEEAVASAEGNKELNWFFGLALMQDGQEDKAIIELEKGQEYGFSMNSNNILYLIDIYAKRNNYLKIIPLYERLIKLEPVNPQYYASLAVAYAGAGDKEKMTLNIEKAVELQPELAPEAKKFLEQNGVDINKLK